MVITRQYAAKNNIQLDEGLLFNNRKNKPNNDLHIIIKILLFILLIIIPLITYYYLFEYNTKSLYNFIIIDLPEKTIVSLYNKIPARPYNYFLDMIQEYNIEYNIDYL